MVDGMSVLDEVPTQPAEAEGAEEAAQPANDARGRVAELHAIREQVRLGPSE